MTTENPKRNIEKVELYENSAQFMTHWQLLQKTFRDDETIPKCMPYVILENFQRSARCAENRFLVSNFIFQPKLVLYANKSLPVSTHW